MSPVRWNAHDDDVPVLLHARITPAGATPPWKVERVMLLTPYVAETLLDDALHAGWGARLELTLAAEASNASLAQVRDQFSRLQGVALDVRREHRVGVGVPRRSAA